jgi:hypothetical protein
VLIRRWSFQEPPISPDALDVRTRRNFSGNQAQLTILGVEFGKIIAPRIRPEPLDLEETNVGLELRAFLVLFLLSLAVPVVLFLSLRTSLRQLLQQTVKTDAGVTFYLRSFLLVLFLSALSVAIGTSFDLKPDSRFMEYVWKGAEGLSGTLLETLLFTVAYAVLITILVATLKIKDDK